VEGSSLATSHAQNLAVVGSIYEAFGRGDIDAGEDTTAGG
jgi:hypothetical protein